MMKEHQEKKMVSGLTANYNQTQTVQVDFQPNKNWGLEQQGQVDNELQRIRQEYLNEINERKKQFQKRKREQFGASSSEQDDIGASQSDSDSGRRKSTMEEQSKYKQSQKIKQVRLVQKIQKCQVYFSIKKLKENWSLEQLNFDDHSFSISEKPYNLKEIHKIKIIQGVAVGDCHRIKLSTIDQNELFIAASCKPYRDLPLNYYIFAFILQQKLINMGKKLLKCTLPSVPGIPETLVKNSYNYGKIFKKSQVLGKWQERLIVINREGIYSYKKFNEKHSMFIAGNTVKQIWSRFEIEDGLLVIKILHSNSTKTEFGLPLTELLDRRAWLFSFYLLAFPQ